MGLEVTIPQEEYEQLLRDQQLLNHLRENGVYDWEGYSILDNDEDDAKWDGGV